MGCSSCGKANVNLGKPILPDVSSPQNQIKPTHNLIEAAMKQPDKFKWFRDGISGIVKCFTGVSVYKDEDIVKNRDVCRGCEYSTKDENGKMTTKSQCMAPDPAKNNAPCACFIVCKTQAGKCQLNKWTHISITINNKTTALKDDDVVADI